MRLRDMVRAGALTLAMVGTGLTAGSSAKAQMGGPPPGMMAKIKKWQKWGEDHKRLTQLGDQLFQIGKMNEDPSVALNKSQAARMLAIINPVKPKTTMSEDEASSVYRALGNVLTTKQIKKMTQIEPPSVTMRKRGFGGGGGGRPAGGAMPAFPDPPKTGWNPFNPVSFPFESARPRVQQSMNQFLGDLQRRAHS